MSSGQPSAGRRELDAAWDWRERRGLLVEGALRVFYGPGEGSGALRDVAIDRFVDQATGAAHAWVTGWGGGWGGTQGLELVTEFLSARGAASAVALIRPERALPAEPVTVLGSPPAGRFTALEQGARFQIALQGSRHPGLFLDHAPLRAWLREHARGWRALNAFAYTGSLSVALGLAGAAAVDTLDLSKATLAWAEDNWRANELDPARARFFGGDVFEWMPRLKRQHAAYDCVILDPPSFSRSKKGTFSTAKDLKRLHEVAMDLVVRGGHLITSINSENIPREKYSADVQAAALARGHAYEIVREIDLPETFPTRPERPDERYLKGWILRRAK